MNGTDNIDYESKFAVPKARKEDPSPVVARSEATKQSNKEEDKE